MGPTARLVTIKRNGVDGIPFPLTLSSCLFGRGTECDIRIQLPVVSKQHCKIEINKQEAVLYNFSSTNPTQVNGSAIDEPVPLKHGDIITIIDRSFRYENESYQSRSKSPQLPEKIREQKSVRRASRTSFSADSDEEEQDSKACCIITTGNASGGPQVHVKELKQNILTSDGSEDSAVQEPLKAPFSAHPRHGSRNASDPNPGDLKEQSQVAVLGCNGELKPFPTAQFLDNGNKNDSPFKKLYQSMKEEFDGASQRQNVLRCHRKSGSSAAHTAEKSSADCSEKEAQLLETCRSRPRSSRSLRNGPSSPAPETSQAEEIKSDPEPTQTPKRAARSSISLSPLTKVQTPVRHSEQQRSSRKRKSEDLHVAVGEESMSLDKNADVSLKRRRVSFGGHLRPELFDENLPPNTPLKKGETPVKRKSLATHSPAVLKKIIKEQPQSSGKEESLEICSGVKAQNVSIAALAPSPTETPPKTNDQRRRLLKGSAASADGKSAQETDTPKKAGRKSGHLPPKRASISRSQHNILQMISSRRRSGASEANLIVAKSWADVVKLGVKQTQMKVVKPIPPPRQVNKRQRRPHTPKKPPISVHNECSTGHANSPCTIVIGKAQIEKVNAPARPYRMLNNFVFNQKRDYNEDLSGLTEMFKTPVKEKPQMMSTCSATLSNSGTLRGKKSKVISSGEESLPIPSVNLGENVYSGAQNATEEPFYECLPSPMLRRKCIKDEKIVETPKNIHKVTHFDIKTPDPATESLTTVCSTNKLRRSVELRKVQVLPIENKNEETEAGITENLKGKSPAKTPLREKEKEREMKDKERSLETCKENVESTENSAKVTTVRRSRSGVKTCESIVDLTSLKRTPERNSTELILDTQMLQQKTECAKESTNEAGTPTKTPCKSSQPETVYSPASKKRQLKTPVGKVDVKEGLPAPRNHSHIPEEHIHIGKYDKTRELVKETPKQKLDSTMSATGTRRLLRTRKSQPLEDLDGVKELLQTPEHTEEPISEYKAKDLCSSPHTEAMNTPRRKKTSSNTPWGKVDIKEEKAMHTPKATENEDKDIKALNESAKQTLDLMINISGSKTWPKTPKAKAGLLEDLAGFQELFQTPAHAKHSVTEERTPQAPLESLPSRPVDTSTASKRRSKISLGKLDGKVELSTSRKPTQSPSRATPTVPAQERKGIKTSMQTPKQKSDLTGNVTELKRPVQTPKANPELLEDLAGFQELFKTPVHAKDSVTEGTPKMLHESLQSGAVDTSTASKRRCKVSLGKADRKEELSTSRKLTQSPNRATNTPAVPIQDKKSSRTSVQTPKQKLNLTENVTELTRPVRTPKTKAQPVEDMTGFQELFQTPGHAKDLVTEEGTPQTPHGSLQSGAVDTLRASKRRSNILPGKVDGKELSTSRKLTQSPSRATHTPTVPTQEKKGIGASMQTPKQKLDLIGNVTELKRPVRIPKANPELLEDLAGFQELFETPVHAKDSVTEGTPQMFHESLQSGAVDTSATSKRRSEVSLGKVDRKKELSTSRKLTQPPGRATNTVPIQDKKSTSTSMQTPKQKLNLTENVTERKRPVQTPKTKAQLVEDLAGFQELFQTPAHAKDSVTEEGTPQTPHGSLQSGAVDTLTASKRRSKINLGKAELSVSRKLTQSPRRATHTPTVPSQEKKSIRTSLQTPKQKLDLTGNVAELEKTARTPKSKPQTVEDLAGFRELFQTPVTAKETPKIPFRSPQPMPLGTPTTSTRRSKINTSKLDMKEELSLHNKVTHSPGKATHPPLVPVQKKSTRTSTETPKQKLDESENLAELESWLQTPKTKAQPLEDLAGFQELFQTSYYAKDSMTFENPKLFCRSPQLGPVDSATSKRCRKKSLEKVDVKDLSLAREPGQMSKKSMYMSEVKDSSGKSICCEDSAEQTPNPATDKSGGRRPQRTTKVKAQLLEGFTGFQELFQTPGDAKHPITANKTTKMPFISPHSRLLGTSPILNRSPRTGQGIVDMKEVLSAPMELRQSAAKALHEPLVPFHEKSIRSSTEAPVQKQNLRENLSGLKRQLGTPKAEPYVLEDMTGLQELFQTPGHANNPITLDEITKISCRYVQSAPVNTPTASERRPKTNLEKADRKELSSPQKLTQTTGKTMHTSKVLEGDDKVFKHVAEQTLILTPTNKRQPMKCKEDVSPLEDLAGFQELFQTPDQAKDPISVDAAKQLPYISEQTESTDTPIKPVRRCTSSLQGNSVKEHLAVTEISGKVAHTHEEPTDDKESNMFKKSTKRKRDTAKSVASNKRPRRESKKISQPLEDLTGFKELFKTPGYIEESVSDEQITQMPGKLQPESVGTPRRRRVLPSTPRRKRTVKEKQVVLTPKATEDDDKGIRTFKESAKQTLALAANVSGSRCTRIPQTESQILEDLTTFQELFQTPDYAKGPVTTDEITETPSISLQVGSLYTPTSKRHSKTSLGKTDGKKELSSSRRRQSPGRARHIPSVSVQEQEGITASTETPKQNQDPRENLSGIKRQSRTPKTKAHVLEDLTGFQELFQTPEYASDPVTENLSGLRRQSETPTTRAQLLEDLSGLQELFQTPVSHYKQPLTEVETPKTPHRSPQLPSIDTSAASKKHSKINLEKIDIKEELSSLRKLTQSAGKLMHTPLVLVQEGEGIRASTGAPQEKLAMTENLAGLKSCPQTRKTKAKPLEDLAGLQELFQTPHHAKDLVTPVKTTQTPHRSQVTPVDTVRTSERCPRTSMGKDVQAELPMVRKQTLEKTVYTHKEAKDDKMFKEPAKRKLGPAEIVTGTKRLRREPKEKTETLEDLSGLQQLFQIPGPTEAFMSDKKAAIVPYKSPQSELIRTPKNIKRNLRARPRKANEKEDSSVVRKLTRTSKAITCSSKVPEDDDKGSRPLEELETKTLDLAVGGSGSRRWPRAAKAKAQSTEVVSGSRELSQTEFTEKSMSDEKTTDIPCKSPQVPGDTSGISRRRPRTRFGKADVTKELSAQRKQTQTSGETMSTHKEPTSDDKNVKEIKESIKCKLDQEENITGSKRLRGTRKEKTQLLEDLAGSKELIQKSAYTEETLNEKITKMPSYPSQPEPADIPASTKRQLRTRLGNVSVKEGLSVVRKPTRMSRATTHTSKMPEGNDKDIRSFKESSEPTLNPAISVKSNRRCLRASKAKSEVEDLPGPKERSQTPDHTEEQVNDVHSPNSTLQQIPDSLKPQQTLRRALRVHKEKPREDLVDTKDPASSQHVNNMLLAPETKSGKSTGARGVCSVMAPQEPVKENRVHSKQRTTRRERHQSPGPLNIVKKCARIVINRIEPVEEQNNTKSIKKEQDEAPPNKGMSLRTRRQNKTDINQQRLEIPSSEKSKIKRREKKSMKTSEEIEQRSPDDGAENPASDGKVSGNRVCLRSGRQNKSSRLHTAEEDGKEKSADLPVKNQEEKEVTNNSETVSLRSRRARAQPKANTLERDSEPRTTRGTKRCAEDLEKDKNIMETNKIRTRSHRKIENI